MDERLDRFNVDIAKFLKPEVGQSLITLSYNKVKPIWTSLPVVMSANLYSLMPLSQALTRFVR